MKTFVLEVPVKLVFTVEAGTREEALAKAKAFVTNVHEHDSPFLPDFDLANAGAPVIDAGAVEIADTDIIFEDEERDA